MTQSTHRSAASPETLGRRRGIGIPAFFAMVRTLSETAVLPIAGMILTFVLCYELIQVIIEKNNMHEFDVFNLYKWIFKTFCAVFILTHTFDIVMFIFALAQNVINDSAGIISGSLDVNIALTDLEASLESMGIWELIGVWLELNIAGLGIWIMSICIFVITFGRMIEIYCASRSTVCTQQTVRGHLRNLSLARQ